MLSLQPASITSSDAFQPECNGLPQFREDVGKPSVVIILRLKRTTYSQVSYGLFELSFKRLDIRLQLVDLFITFSGNTVLAICLLFLFLHQTL